MTRDDRISHAIGMIVDDAEGEDEGYQVQRFLPPVDTKALPGDKDKSLDLNDEGASSRVATNPSGSPDPNAYVIAQGVGEKDHVASNTSGGEKLNPEKAEAIIREQLTSLSDWHDTNIRLANRDYIRYWAFKFPALSSSVAVPVLEALGHSLIAMILGGVAALCIGMDAAFPGGRLHNVHRRAANETRRLEHEVLTSWRMAQLRPTHNLVAAALAILQQIQNERRRIDDYVTQAETNLGR